MPKPLPKELLSKAGTAPLPGTAKLPNAGAALPEVPCVDTKDECKEWAAKGECTKAAPKMDKLCPASCGACPVKPDEVFGDLDHDSDGNVTVKELAKRLAAVDEARRRRLLHTTTIALIFLTRTHRPAASTTRHGSGWTRSRAASRRTTRTRRSRPPSRRSTFSPPSPTSTRTRAAS